MQISKEEIKEIYEYNTWSVPLTQVNINNFLYKFLYFDKDIGQYFRKNSLYNPNLGIIEEKN